ncbi:hypothetical protein GCM10022419_009510 [Nonomuraea rosea]|jgi:hypothetical protein|uniref:Uncharacterized protein n=1 Tax=Nonomuraea rosea TaxID=638574 RepID=A0ABP6VBC7_9ACTN
MAMIEQWTSEYERELEARCARFRIAKLALDRTDDDRREEGWLPAEADGAA